MAMQRFNKKNVDPVKGWIKRETYHIELVVQLDFVMFSDQQELSPDRALLEHRYPPDESRSFLSKHWASFHASGRQVVDV